MNKQPQLTESTRKKLVDAFWSLYRIKKIEKITIKEITDTAGYNRSTFYKYFIDVYDILEYIEDTLIEYIRENIIVDTLTIDGEHIFIKKISDIYEKKGEYINILLNEKENSLFSRKFKSALKPALYTIFDIDTSKNDIYNETIFEFSLSAILGAFTYWYTNKDLFSSEEFIILIRSLLATGVLNKLK